MISRGVLWLRGRNILPIVLFSTNRGDMLLYSSLSPKLLHVRDFENSLTMKQIIARVEANPGLCSPDERDLYFEVQEIVCFGLGYKQVVLRQRILTHQENSGQMVSMAKSVYSPYIPPLIEYLTNHDDVGYRISTNHWGEIEDTFVFYHRGFKNTADLMVELKVQDTTIPGQNSKLEKIIYAVLCGRMLGYSEKSTYDYVVEVSQASESEWRKGLERYSQYTHRFKLKPWDLGQSRVSALVDFKFWATNDMEFDFEPIRKISHSGSFMWDRPDRKDISEMKSEL